MREFPMVLAPPKRKGKKYQRYMLTERWRVMIASTRIPTRQLDVSGWTSAQLQFCSLLLKE